MQVFFVKSPLFIKIVLSDAEGVWAIIGYPGGRRGLGAEKEERALGDVKALKADLRREDRVVARCVVDRAVEDGAELHAVFFVKDNTVDGVRVVARAHAIENYVADGDLTEKRLACRLGVDYPREPEDLVISIKPRGVSQRAHTTRKSQ